jgi:hypothetical protein
MAPEPADNTTLTRAQKRQLTVAERQEKARQEQKAFEAQSSEPIPLISLSRPQVVLILFSAEASGGRQAKLVAQKNASKCRYKAQNIGLIFCSIVWNVDKPVSRKRTSSTAKVSETAKKPREAIAAGMCCLFE